MLAGAVIGAIVVGLLRPWTTLVDFLRDFVAGALLGGAVGWALS